MQAPIPPPHRLHWIPIAPSWIVAAGILIIAAMPHQLPDFTRVTMSSVVGSVLYLGGCAWLFQTTPVLAVALMMLLVGVITYQSNHRPTVLGKVEFFQPNTLVKDRVKPQGQRWLQEDVMMEDPHVIQERVEGPGLLMDPVKTNHKWFVEEEMHETPHGIQERPVGGQSTAESGLTEYEQSVFGGHHQ